MAKSHAQSVRAIVAPEPPLARVHPKTRKWQRFFAGVYYAAFRYGATLAMLRFAFGLGLDHSFRQAIKAAKTMRRYREKSGNHYLHRKVTIDFSYAKSSCPSQTICRISRPLRETGSGYLWPLERVL
jgi:hypothetical protein